MHLGGFAALDMGTHARIANAASRTSHQDGLLESAVELDVSALETANDAFAVSLCGSKRCKKADERLARKSTHAPFEV